MDQQASSAETSGASLPYWIASAPPKPSTNPLTTNITVDTCIIGAGLAGLTTAYFLSKQGQKVAVLEDGEVCSGETGRTTGYLTWVIDDGIQQIISYYGRDNAALHVESHRTAVDLVEQIARDEGIDCEFKRIPNYWFSRKPKSEQDGNPDKEIMKEYEAMLDIGMKEVSVMESAPYGLGDGKCLKIPNQGQFHVVKYCYGLVKCIQAAGSSVYTRSKVADYKDGKQPWAKTSDGYTVTSKHLVMATNAPLQFLTTIAKLEAYRSYVIAGEVPRGKYEWCMFQDDSMLHHKPYKYGRFTPLNPTSDLLMIGGEDHLVGFKKDFEERYQELEKWALQRFPDFRITYRWSGQIQEPADLIAYLGLDPGRENTYIITGDSGMGMTHTTIGGKLVSDLILGNQNPWKELYDPKRLKLKALPEISKHLVEINAQFSDYGKPGDVPDIEDIIPGEGAIICKSLKHFAVYKDEQGKVSAYTAVCPHLKGLVRWNTAEKSWDCPLHGSRFDKHGKTINGPAKTDLAPVGLEEVLK